MANWYHCSVKPVSRSAGRSVVAAAAYRIGERLHDDRTQTTHDYTRRSGVEASFIIAPANAPEWASDPERLWNAAEAAENRCNSRTAREVELALPSGVSSENREQITRDFAEHLVERYGVAVMVALHEPSRHGDDRNHHAHILITTRRMDEEGLGKKTRELDDQTTGKAEVLHIREYAADLINEALANAGSDEQIDHRSFKDRGIDQIPTKHLSLEALAMEKRGEHSGQGDRNREAQQANQNINALLDEREELDRQIAEASQEPQAAENGTYWQDKIKSEREEGETPPATITENENKQSPFTDSVNLAYVEQIIKHGEITHKGLVGSWAEHAAELMRDLSHEVYYLAHRTADQIKDAWGSLRGIIENDKGHEPDFDR